jgi:hypothetical protein
MEDRMAKLGGLVLSALAAVGLSACQTTGQGGGTAGSGVQAAVPPPGMTAAQGAAYCSKLAQTYGEYVGSFGGYLGGDSRGGEAADLDARVAIANCQDGNYASGIPVLQQKLRDARVTVPPPPTG